MWASTKPELDHGYSTTPQTALNARVLPYKRGKGLGGSSVINFLAYTYGPEADYERWAETVGSEEWRWERVKERYKAVGLSSPRFPSRRQSRVNR